MSGEKKTALFALGGVRETVEVEAVDGSIIEIIIRPLTWAQEYRIAAVVGEKVKHGVPKDVADRDYMLLSVKEGIEDPPMDETELMEIKVGEISRISKRIAALSGHAQKKESKDSLPQMTENDSPS